MRNILFALTLGVSTMSVQAEWLSKADSYISVPSFGDLIDNLPDEKEWGKSLQALQVKLDEKGDTLSANEQKKLRMLITTLAYMEGENDIVNAQLDFMAKDKEIKHYVENMRQSLSQRSRRSGSNEMEYDELISSIKDASDKVRRRQHYINGKLVKEPTYESFYLTDAQINKVGKERLKEIITEALKKPLVIQLDRNTDYYQEVKAIVMEKPDDHKAPQYSFMASLDDVDTILKTNKKFKSTRAEGYEEAYALVILGSYLRGDTDKAFEMVGEYEEKVQNGSYYDFLDQSRNLEKQGHAEKLWDFYRVLVQQQASTDFWDHFVDLSVRVKKSDELTKIAESLQNHKDPSMQLIGKLQLTESYLAADQLEKAKVLMKEVLSTEISSQEHAELLRDFASTCRRIANLNVGIDYSTEALEKELAAVKYINESSESDDDDHYHYHSSDSIAKIYSKYERYEKALEMADKEIEEQKKKPVENSYSLHNLGALKVQCYTALGKTSELLAFMKDYPYFNSDNVERLLSALDDNASLEVAKILKDNGHGDYVYSLIERQLVNDASEDATYEFLINEYGKEKAMVLINKIKSFHPFEERPYIWEAKIKLADGKVDEAYALTKKAIAMDPSDGEQGKETRMRAYAVLSDVYEQKGDAEKTEFFDNVVKAIRLSEGADDYYYAGLVSRAYDNYENSLEIFYDAYCIHSRLARNYSEDGQLDKAAVHYQKAFELMPDSFGRVESHCFGCEGAFDGDQAQSIADKVFAKMLLDQPNHPQLNYLMGYLRYAKKEHKAATVFLKKAVELDPQYLNAYKKLKDVAKKLGDTENLTFALNKIDELDPYQARMRKDANVTFKQLKKNLTAKNALIDTLTEINPSMKLEGTKQEQEKRSKSNSYRSHYNHYSSSDSSQKVEFSELIKNDGFIRTLIQLSAMN